LGVLAAAIFAGQMLNFTVVGGTSGHLMGAAIATILLGPWPAILVMTTVVGVPGADLSGRRPPCIGANIFNMAIIGVAVSYFVYRTVQSLAEASDGASSLAASPQPGYPSRSLPLAVALQLALSGTSPANIAIPTMGIDPCLDRDRRRADQPLAPWR